MDTLGKMKESFNANLTKLIESKSGNSDFLTKEKYIQLTQVI